MPRVGRNTRPGMENLDDGGSRAAPFVARYGDHRRDRVIVESVTNEGSPDLIAVPERVAVFDNDGTLWTEKPMPIQLDFMIRHFAEQAEADPALRENQPYKAAFEKDLPLVRRRHGQALPGRRWRSAPALCTR